jgi:hypothetical protein
MSKALTVQYKGREITLAIEKVDRTRLYGYVETEVLDEGSRRCQLVTLNGDGHTLAGRGDTANVLLSPTRDWRERSQLTPVDTAGKPITPVPSTFAAPVALDATATVDDYLAHNVHLVYHLTCEGDMEDLLADLRAGAIYRFPFSYRGGLEAYPAFLLAGGDGHPFLVVGSEANLLYVGLKQAVGPVEDETGEEDEEDLLDFRMM